MRAAKYVVPIITPVLSHYHLFRCMVLPVCLMLDLARFCHCEMRASSTSTHPTTKIQAAIMRFGRLGAGTLCYVRPKTKAFASKE